ncbi:glycoside hydrolase family 76 protein [Amycolatopsis sp. H20-H5]|uniref:glycoside hydrolase family 76 protein n=1 Tax=Amycolatopsis sp. H20-H5 TaxID=3046309 RepID=UPI002DB975B6|nr:glycoside hydrolase family 76 protein [Amycolatopsis sp. H20-H5]MEC3980096.1 glycoside hydrolase family 76 protein [Amycolatopsis sp. H20-H5]
MRTSLILILLTALLLPAAPPVASAAEAVCSLSCDRLDPSRAAGETFPVADQLINGRRMRLHVSDPDGMGWASIDAGAAGDAVWLDRSWDGGKTWEPLLGKASIPATWTGTRTLMYNLTDPAHHRRGLLRACGDAQAVACTNWVYPSVCDVNCDGADPGRAVGEVQPVAPTTLFGRTIRLHVEGNSMAWASVDGAGPGDEVWLDRSWDAGVSWPDGSSLGRTAQATRTAMFATRDPRGKLYGGAVRACGREATHAQGSCTAWARPVPSRAKAAADTLMWSYDPAPGWWPSSWWNSAATLTAVIDFADRTGTRDYDWVIARTFDANRGVFPAGGRSGDPIEGHFISRAIDDTAWWGLAWLAAYDHTRDPRYLAEATTIADYVGGFWDTGTCGGGVWWDRERTYKNAVTSGLYLRLAAGLHLRTTGDTAWGQRARAAGDWYLGSGLVNASGLVNDGLTGDCRNNGQTVWTYNQGLAVGGLVELWRGTSDPRYLDSARRLADAAIASPVLTGAGVLTESCDTGTRSCDDNQKQFKGVFLRYLGDLAQVTGAASYQQFAHKQADTLWVADRDPLNRIGERWAGTSPGQVDWRTQGSALGALTAAS